MSNGWGEPGRFGTAAIISADALRQHLRAGRPLDQQAPTLALQTQEAQYWSAGCTGWEFFAVDVEYETVRNPTMTVQGLAMNALVHGPMNRRRREQAAREAAPRWRPAWAASMYCTDRRLIFHEQTNLASWWYTDIGKVQLCSQGVYMNLRNGHASIIDVGDAGPWFYILVWWLLYGTVAELPL